MNALELVREYLLGKGVEVSEPVYLGHPNRRVVESLVNTEDGKYWLRWKKSKGAEIRIRVSMPAFFESDPPRESALTVYTVDLHEPDALEKIYEFVMKAPGRMSFLFGRK
jgi:hypothetical protein